MNDLSWIANRKQGITLYKYNAGCPVKFKYYSPSYLPNPFGWFIIKKYN